MIQVEISNVPQETMANGPTTTEVRVMLERLGFPKVGTVSLKAMVKCTAALNISGQGYMCDKDGAHEIHSNKKIRAIWQ